MKIVSVRAGLKVVLSILDENSFIPAWYEEIDHELILWGTHQIGY